MQTRVYFLFLTCLLEPGIGNVFDGSGDRAAFAGAGGRSRGA